MHDFPFDELLSAYFDGEVSAEEREQVERLLETSAEARRRLNEFVVLSDLVRELPLTSAPQELAPAVHLRTEREVLLGRNGLASQEVSTQTPVSSGAGLEPSAAASSVSVDSARAGVDRPEVDGGGIDRPGVEGARRGRKWPALISLVASVAAVGLTTWLLARSGSHTGGAGLDPTPDIAFVHDPYERTVGGNTVGGNTFGGNTAGGNSPRGNAEPHRVALNERDGDGRRKGIDGLGRGGADADLVDEVTMSKAAREPALDSPERDAFPVASSDSARKFAKGERRAANGAIESESERFGGSPQRKRTSAAPASGLPSDSSQSEFERQELAEKQSADHSGALKDARNRNPGVRNPGMNPGDRVAGKASAAPGSAARIAPEGAPLADRKPGSMPAPAMPVPALGGAGHSVTGWADGRSPGRATESGAAAADSEAFLNERGVIIGGGLNDRMRTLGEALLYFDTSGEKVVVIEMVVVDYWRAVDQFQYLLARNSIVDLKNADRDNDRSDEVVAGVNRGTEGGDGAVGGLGGASGRASDKALRNEARRDGDLPPVERARGQGPPMSKTPMSRDQIAGRELRKQAGPADDVAELKGEQLKRVQPTDPQAGLLAVYAECNQLNLANSIRDLVGQGYLVDAQLRPPMLLADAEEAVAAANLAIQSENLRQEADGAAGQKKAAEQATDRQGVRQKSGEQSAARTNPTSTGGAPATVPAAPAAAYAARANASDATVPYSNSGNQNPVSISNYGTEEQREALVSQLLENGLQRSADRNGYSYVSSNRGTNGLAAGDSDVAVAELPDGVEKSNLGVDKSLSPRNQPSTAAAPPQPAPPSNLSVDPTQSRRRPGEKAKEGQAQPVNAAVAAAKDSGKREAPYGRPFEGESLEGSAAYQNETPRAGSYQLRVRLPLPEDAAPLVQAEREAERHETAPTGAGGGSGSGAGVGGGAQARRVQTPREPMPSLEKVADGKADSSPAGKSQLASPTLDAKKPEPGKLDAKNTASSKVGASRTGSAVANSVPPSKPGATAANEAKPAIRAMPKAEPHSVVQKGASAPATPGGNIGPSKGDPQAEKLEALGGAVPAQSPKAEVFRKTGEAADTPADALSRQGLPLQNQLPAAPSGGSLRVLFVFRPQQPDAAGGDLQNRNREPEAAGRREGKLNSPTAAPAAPPVQNRPGNK